MEVRVVLALEPQTQALIERLIQAAVNLAETWLQPGPKPMRGPTEVSPWTEERRAIVRREWQAGTKEEAVWRMLGEVEGPPLPQWYPGIVATTARRFGVRRTPERRHEARTEALAKRRAARQAAVAEARSANEAAETRAEPPVAAAPADPTPKPTPNAAPEPAATDTRPAPPPRPIDWSVARDDALERGYEQGEPIPDLVRRLNRMSGPRLTAGDVVERAEKWGFRHGAGASKPPSKTPSKPELGNGGAAPAKPAEVPGRPERIEANWAAISQWATTQRLRFRGDNMDEVNRARARAGLPPFVLVDHYQPPAA